MTGKLDELLRLRTDNERLRAEGERMREALTTRDSKVAESTHLDFPLSRRLFDQDFIEFVRAVLAPSTASPPSDVLASADERETKLCPQCGKIMGRWRHPHDPEQREIVWRCTACRHTMPCRNQSPPKPLEDDHASPPPLPLNQPSSATVDYRTIVAHECHGKVRPYISALCSCHLDPKDAKEITLGELCIRCNAGPLPLNQGKVGELVKIIEEWRSRHSMEEGPFSDALISFDLSTLAQPDAPSPWISVKDRLPQLGQVVIAHSKFWDIPTFVVLVGCTLTNEKPDEFAAWEDPRGRVISGISHWMPIPKPPTPEEK